jgi:hypothetical protein
LGLKCGEVGWGALSSGTYTDRPTFHEQLNMSAYSQFILVLLSIERRGKLNLDVQLYVHTNPSYPGKFLSIMFDISIVSRAGELKCDSQKLKTRCVATNIILSGVHTSVMLLLRTEILYSLSKEMAIP